MSGVKETNGQSVVAVHAKGTYRQSYGELSFLVLRLLVLKKQREGNACAKQTQITHCKSWQLTFSGVMKTTEQNAC